MSNRYKVHFYQDNDYEVIDTDDYYSNEGAYSCFIGSLSDCEAWIRLTEDGYLE